MNFKIIIGPAPSKAPQAFFRPPHGREPELLS